MEKLQPDQAKINLLEGKLDAINSSQTSLHELFMQAPAFIALVKGPQHVFELANPLYMQMIGEDRSVIGKPVKEALPEVIDQGFLEILDYVYQTGKPFKGREIPVQINKSGDGSMRLLYLDFVYQPFVNSEGKVEGIFVHGVDVTEQVIARKRIEETEAKLSAIFHQATAGIVQTSLKDQFLLINNRFCEIVGYSKKELAKMRLRDITHPEDYEPEKVFYKKLKQGGDVYRADRRFIHKEGYNVWTNLNVSLIKDSQGKATSSLAVVVDITERKLAEEFLRQSEERFKTYAEAMPQMAFIADSKGNISYYNKRWYDYVGESEEMKGWGWKNIPIHHPDDFERTLKTWETALKNGKPYQIEYRLRRHDGEYRWHLGRAEPVRDRNGNIEMWLGTNTDIHEQKEAEEAMRASENLMRLITDSIPAFVAYISKDEKYEFVNKAYEKWFGISKEEIKGKHAAKVIGEKAYQKAKESIYNVLKGKQVIYENTLINKDGVEKHLDIEYIADKAEDGTVKGFVALGHDVTARKISEDALRKVKDQLTVTFQNVPSGIFLLDSKGKSLFTNQLGASFLGFDSAEELLAINDVKEIRNIISNRFSIMDERGNPLPEGYSIFSKVISGDKNVQDILSFYDIKEKKNMWALLKANCIKNSEDELELILVSMTDITHQKEAEQAIRRSEEYYKTMTDNTPVITWITDFSGRCTYMNRQWYELTGMQTEEAVGFGWMEAVHPDDIERVGVEFYKIHLKKDPFSLELRLKDKKGSYRWFLTSALPKYDEKGKYEGFIGSIVDIDERKNAEDKLKESEEFSRTLLESSPDCVEAIDLDNRLISINSRGIEMLEIENLDNYIGKDWLELWEGEYNEMASDALNKAKNGKVGHFRGYFPTEKGKHIWWDVLVAPVYGPEEKVDRLVSVSRDITKLKELEQQKDDFIGIASHELKTPVTSLKAYAQVLQSRFAKANDQQSAIMLEKMDIQLNKLTGLISDLLDVTKIEQGKLVFREEQFKMNELIYEVVEEVQRTSEKHKIIVETDKEVELTGDSERIGQVVTNFLTNAIRYSPQADKVVISTQVKDAEVICSVQDFGLGISKENQEKIFERFYRVGGSGYETYPGLGLGLFISNEIITRHYGKTWVESTLGEGSVFYFSLPKK